MIKLRHIFQIIFAVSWFVFGLQHFLYADFVATLVPSYFPAGKFWAYLTGAAMIAAALSFVSNIKVRLAATLLGVMLGVFVLLIHIPKIISGNIDAIGWTRAIEDLFLTLTAFILAEAWSKQVKGKEFPPAASKFLIIAAAILLMAFGIEEFLNPAFLTAKVPDFFPLRIFWVYLTGALMIIGGMCVLINKSARMALIIAGSWMLIINLTHHISIMTTGWQTPVNWTAAMIDLAINCSVFFMAAVAVRNPASDNYKVSLTDLETPEISMPHSFQTRIKS